MWPCGPTSALAGHVFKTDAVYRANRNAQLATGAIFLDDGVHHLVTTQDGIRRADREAQRAAYAPLFINNGDRAWAFCAIRWAQGQHWPPGDGCQAFNASSAPRWALVDSGSI